MTERSSRTRAVRALAVPLLTLTLITGCSSSAASRTSPGASAGATASTGRVRISSRDLPGLGSVLVDERGRTLYVFEPDADAQVTCVKDCAKVWPPAFVPAGQKPSAAGDVKGSLLGTDPDPEGGQISTYSGWPLYTYVGDTAPGQDHGQALNLNGGLWYAISPSGTVIKAKP